MPDNNERSPIPEDVEIIHSTWRDNPFLDPAYCEMLQRLEEEDVNFYNIYTLGLWGRLEDLIYTKYRIIDTLPSMKEAHWVYGLDFGLVAPSALVKVYQLEHQFYVEERLYRTGMTNLDIIGWLSHEERGDIYADPTEKQMIEEIYQAGYNIFPANPNVNAGIDLCQRQLLNIPKESVHLIDEIRGYHWKKDKNGNVLSDPVRFKDHLVSAMRYAIQGMTSKFGYATAEPMRPRARTGYRL